MQETQNKIEVCASLIEEHRQMETLLGKLKQALAELDSTQGLNAVKALMGEIEPEMNTHFACEEKVLFPAVTPYHPMVLMEVEHEELIALRDELLALLSNNNEEQTLEKADTLQKTGNHFIDYMLDHIGREDAGIFPMCERALSNDEKEAVIAGMTDIRKQAAQTPTPSITRPERTFQSYQLDLSSEPQRELFSKQIFEDATLKVKQITIQAGKSMAAYWTPKQAIIICMRGEGTFMANDEELALVPGTIVKMSPQLRHGVSAKTDCDLLFLLQDAPY